MKIQIEIEKLIGEIEKLATFSSTQGSGVTRVLYSNEDQASRKWLREIFEAANLAIETDGLGNLFARWVGSEPGLAAVGTGSHTDAIPHSGKYDGVVGVLGAIEAIRAMQRSGFQPKRSIEILHFTAEEPTRFGIGCIGSRALGGVLSPPSIRVLKDSEGRSIEELRKEAGFKKDLEKVALPASYFHAFVELHIEQGPRLEKDGLDIGIVSAIAAPATLKITIEGDGGHAGAVLMPRRKDALLPAAKIIQEIEKVALNSVSPDAVATVGWIDIHPGAVNSIPSKVSFLVDIRDVELVSRNAMIECIQALTHDICKQRNVHFQVEILNADNPCKSGKAIMEAIEEACKESKYSYRHLVSRAYHDTLFMAGICPTSMIFIPSFKGYSHRPEEYSSPGEIEKGIRILAKTLAKLSLS